MACPGHFSDFYIWLAFYFCGKPSQLCLPRFRENVCVTCTDAQVMELMTATAETIPTLACFSACPLASTTKKGAALGTTTDTPTSTLRASGYTRSILSPRCRYVVVMAPNLSLCPGAEVSVCTNSKPQYYLPCSTLYVCCPTVLPPQPRLLISHLL